VNSAILGSMFRLPGNGTHSSPTPDGPQDWRQAEIERARRFFERRETWSVVYYAPADLAAVAESE
jgi:hypothetical protein